jgi:hypothetical protein
MDKLSNVLPTSPRVKSVDLRDAHPMRPGAPGFGTPTGSTSHDRLSISETARDQALQERMAAPMETARAKIASEVTRNFFENRISEPAAGSLNSHGEDEIMAPIETLQPQKPQAQPRPAKLDLQA